MRVQVVARTKDVGRDVRAWTEERVRRQLARFSDGVQRVVVRLQDANGPNRGGLDKRVSLDLDGGPRGHIHLSGTASSYESALADALHRLKSTVLRAPSFGSRRPTRPHRTAG